MRLSYENSKPNNNLNRRQPKCQICDQLGHIAKSCPQLHSHDATINCTTTPATKDQNWLLELAASHNIMSDFANLNIHSKYDDIDEVILGDGSGLPVSHIGSLVLGYVWELRYSQLTSAHLVRMSSFVHPNKLKLSQRKK